VVADTCAGRVPVSFRPPNTTTVSPADRAAVAAKPTQIHFGSGAAGRSGPLSTGVAAGAGSGCFASGAESDLMTTDVSASAASVAASAPAGAPACTVSSDAKS
jgi:hypothetical protein